MIRLSLYWRLSRPFTCIPPITGIFSGALIGIAAARPQVQWPPIALAVVAAAVLNAASNALNQICDVENDRVNKPQRPLPSGALTLRQAAVFSALAYALALALAFEVNEQTFAIYVFAALATVFYSAPPIRLKQRPWASNFIIALTRGELLKAAGWAAVATVLSSWEPWYIGLIYFVFLLGATATKDFADIEGDRAAHCETLPVKYGPATAARIIAPAFIAPWILMAAGVFLHIMTGDAAAILALSLILLAWGAIVVRAMLRDPLRLSREGENHPAWRQMYWMMMAAHLGLAGAYLLNLWR